MSYENDDLTGLSEYLSEFSSLGSVPTSLGGYGFARGRHLAELGALGASEAGAPTKSSWEKSYPPTQPAPAGTVNPAKIGATALQNFLNALQVWVTKSGKADSETFAAWDRYVSVFREPHSKIAKLRVGGTEPGNEVNTDVYITAQALKRIKDKATATGKLRDELARPLGSKPAATPAMKPSSPVTPKVTPASAGYYVTSTSVIQDILTRLGWRGKGTTSGGISKDLTDGFYGGTTVANWQQSATKRKLDPAITKANADGSQTKVKEATYYALKVLADQLSPATPVTPQPAPAPSATTEITETRLTEVLVRLSDAPPGSSATWDKLVSMYQAFAQAAKLDPTISKRAVRCIKAPCPSDRVSVNKDTWDTLIKKYDAKAPAPPPPPPAQKSEVEQAMEVIKKSATSSVPSKTLKSYFNIAISQGVLKREKFSSEKWSADYAPLLIAMRQVAGSAKTAWEQLLVPGKLVAKDLMSVKLPADQAAEIKKTLSDYATAQKAETERIKGFTKVNTATVIESINKLGVSSKAFDTAGSHAALVDAIKTFYENTKRKLPSGDLVKTVAATKDVFVNDDALKALADEKQKAEERKSKTEGYRKKMVAEALQASSKAVSIDNLQRAFIETVHAGKAGKAKDLYSVVKRNGAFDTATRAAYTELARERTIGPAVLQFEKLLKDQLGPNYKTSLTEKVQNDVWDEFLKAAVSKDSVKTLPALADIIDGAARAYKNRVTNEKDNAAKKAEADKLLADTVKKSDTIVSLFDVQMGLLEPDKPKAVGVKTTGRADEPTKAALFNLVADTIFGTGHREKWSWDEYLNKVGIKVESAANVTLGWSGANWVALPKAAADRLVLFAAKWLKSHALPAGYEGLAPLPLSNQTLLLNIHKPSVVRVTVPTGGGTTDEPKKDDTEGQKKKAEEAAAKARKAKKKADEAAAKARKAKKKAEEAAARAAKKKKEADAAAELAAKNKADAAAQEAARQAKAEADAAAAEANKAALEAAAAKVESNAATQDAQAAGGAGGAGGATGPVTAGGSEVNITFTDREAGPVIEPIQAGMGGSWLWMILAGLGYMAYSSKDKKTPQRIAARAR